jgi:hypothetical protein
MDLEAGDEGSEVLEPPLNHAIAQSLNWGVTTSVAPAMAWETDGGDKYKVREHLRARLCWLGDGGLSGSQGQPRDRGGR